VNQHGKVMFLIIIGAAAFVIGIAGFSVMLGVFSSAEPNTEQQAEADAAEGEATRSNEWAELEDLEKELLGVETAGKEIDFDDMMAQAEKDAKETIGDDSAAVAAWLDREKAKLVLERQDIDAKLKLLQDRKKELDTQEQRLKQIIAKVEQMESARVGSLAKLYDGMKPAQVAPLLVKLPDESTVQVLLKMKPANAARILGELSPSRAASISAQMLTLSEE